MPVMGCWMSETQNAGCGLGDGARASANTSGPDFTRGQRPKVKLRTQGIRTERRNLFLLPDRFLIEIRSRRWPDVSPTPSFVDQSRHIEICGSKLSLRALMTCRRQAAGCCVKRDLLLLLGDLAGLLRSLLHCALRLLCLLGFLSHSALLM